MITSHYKTAIFTMKCQNETTHIPAFMNDLKIKGYAVVPGVLSPEEVESAKKMFRNYQQSIPHYFDIHGKIHPRGIHKYAYAGHTDFAWFIRTRPRVVSVFQTIWDTKDLVTSFDGSCFIPKDCKKNNKPWAHWDQGPTRKGMHCVQGFVSLTSNKERTLVVYEGSHRLHEKYFKDRGIKSSNDWHIIKDKDFLASIKASRRVVTVPAGALVLWESRVIHENQYGCPGSEERMVQYVSMLPKKHKRNTSATIRKRKRYFEERRTTSHWAYPIRVNGKQPRIFNKMTPKLDYDKINIPDLSALDQKKIMRLIV